MMITHYQADIKIEGHYFPDRGEITEKDLLELANSGTTPDRIWPALRERADRIREALLSGRVAETSTAIISPLTAEDFRSGRLTATTGYTRI